MVCSRGHRHRDIDGNGLDAIRPTPGGQLRVDRRRIGVDYRLSLRNGSRNTDVDHGRHRASSRDGRGA